MTAWDITRARAMWDEGIPITEIARSMNVKIGSITFQAAKLHWPQRSCGLRRRWRCCVCGTPASAVRRGTRCPQCSLDAKRVHTQEANKRRRRWIVVCQGVADDATTDPDILAYRRERDRRRSVSMQLFEAARDALAHEMSLTQPLRKATHKRGYMPQTFGSRPPKERSA